MGKADKPDRQEKGNALGADGAAGGGEERAPLSAQTSGASKRAKAPARWSGSGGTMATAGEPQAERRAAERAQGEKRSAPCAQTEPRATRSAGARGRGAPQRSEPQPRERASEQRAAQSGEIAEREQAQKGHGVMPFLAATETGAAATAESEHTFNAPEKASHQAATAAV